MKVSKSLLAVIAMAGTMGFSAVASAMDFTVYGSLRGGLQQSDTDDKQVANGISVNANGNVVVQSGGLVAGGYSEDGQFKAGDAAPGGLSIGGPTAGAFVAGGSVTADDAQLELGHGQFGSRIGIKGSEDLGNGAEAGLHWETAVGANGSLENDAADKTLGRHANVWYSGAFGKVTLGQQGNPYRNAANWDQSWWIGGNNRYGDGGSRLQGVRYDGSAGAFNFSVMATAQNDDSNAAAEDSVTVLAQGVASNTANNCTAADASVVTATAAAGAVTCVASRTVDYAKVEAETGIDSWIATGHYDMGVATINLGYRVNNNEAQQVGKSWDNFVISANGSLDALDWYVAFENNTDNANAKEGAISLIGDGTDPVTDADAVNYAANNERAVVDALTTANDVTTIGLFLGYNISDVSKLYFEYEDSANDGLDVLGENLDKNAVLLGYSRQIGPNTSFITEYVTVDNNSELSADSSTLQGYLKVDF